MSDDLFDSTHACEVLLDYLDNHTAASLEEFCTAVQPLAIVIARQLGMVDIEDAAQESIIHLLKVLERFDRQPKNLRAWLSIVIRNKMISTWRYDNAHFPPGVDPALAEEEPAEDIDMAEQGVDRYKAGLRTWVRARFPSLKNPDQMSDLILAGLLDGTPARQFVKSIMAQATPALHPADAQVVLTSAQMFLRILALPNGSLDLSPTQFNEFSPLVDIAAITGVASAQLLAMLLGGSTIKLQAHNNTG